MENNNDIPDEVQDKTKAFTPSTRVHSLFYSGDVNAPSSNEANTNRTSSSTLKSHSLRPASNANQSLLLSTGPSRIQNSSAPSLCSSNNESTLTIAQSSSVRSSAVSLETNVLNLSSSRNNIGLPLFGDNKTKRTNASVPMHCKSNFSVKPSVSSHSSTVNVSLAMNGASGSSTLAYSPNNFLIGGNNSTNSVSKNNENEHLQANVNRKVTEDNSINYIAEGPPIDVNATNNTSSESHKVIGSRSLIKAKESDASKAIEDPNYGNINGPSLNVNKERLDVISVDGNDFFAMPGCSRDSSQITDVDMAGTSKISGTQQFNISHHVFRNGFEDSDTSNDSDDFAMPGLGREAMASSNELCSEFASNDIQVFESIEENVAEQVQSLSSGINNSISIHSLWNDSGNNEAINSCPSLSISVSKNNDDEDDCLVSSSTEKNVAYLPEAPPDCAPANNEPISLPLLDSTVDSTGDPSPLDCIDSPADLYTRALSNSCSPSSNNERVSHIRLTSGRYQNTLGSESLQNISLISFRLGQLDSDSSDSDAGTNKASMHSYFKNSRKGDGNCSKSSLSSSHLEASTSGTACIHKVDFSKDEDSRDSIGSDCGGGLQSSFELGLASAQGLATDSVSRSTPLLPPEQILENLSHACSDNAWLDAGKPHESAEEGLPSTQCLASFSYGEGSSSKTKKANPIMTSSKNSTSNFQYGPVQLVNSQVAKEHKKSSDSVTSIATPGSSISCHNTSTSQHDGNNQDIQLTGSMSPQLKQQHILNSSQPLANDSSSKYQSIDYNVELNSNDYNILQPQHLNDLPVNSGGSSSEFKIVNDEVSKSSCMQQQQLTVNFSNEAVVKSSSTICDSNQQHNSYHTVSPLSVSFSSNSSLLSQSFDLYPSVTSFMDNSSSNGNSEESPKDVNSIQYTGTSSSFSTTCHDTVASQQSSSVISKPANELKTTQMDEFMCNTSASKNETFILGLDTFNEVLKSIETTPRSTNELQIYVSHPSFIDSKSSCDLSLLDTQALSSDPVFAIGSTPSLTTKVVSTPFTSFCPATETVVSTALYQETADSSVHDTSKTQLQLIEPQKTCSNMGTSADMEESDSWYMEDSSRVSALKRPRVKRDGNIRPATEDIISCKDCMEDVTGTCSLHGVQSINDKTVLSRAWASVPSAYLNIRQISSSSGEYGVFSKRNLAAHVFFGPLVAPLCAGKPDTSLIYSVSGNDGSFTYLDTTDIEHCNWMSFVKPAQNYLEQNCIIVERLPGSLFFLTCTAISANTQLKVGYSSQYASKRNLNVLTPTTEEQEELENDNTWPCFECEERFSSSAELQSHLDAHDEHSEPKKRPGVKLRARKGKRKSKSSYQGKHSKNNLKLEKQLKRNIDESQDISPSFVSDSSNANTSSEPILKCLLCKKLFVNRKVLLLHQLEHNTKASAVQQDMIAKLNCPECLKQFTADSELLSHLNSHAIHNNNSKTPCDGGSAQKQSNPVVCEDPPKVISCSICRANFTGLQEMRNHFPEHCINGLYHCPTCNRKFDSYKKIRRHIKAYCFEQLVCNVCNRVFPSAAKLKRHLVVHSNVREFSCEVCGRLFSRKDKLKEHHNRMHGPNSKIKPPSAKHKVTGVHLKSAYQCGLCLLGFKRRGMLVNHFLKCHPSIPISSVPDLQKPLPVVSKEYPCLYCSKVYMTNVRRNQHIGKCHPGEQKATRDMVRNKDANNELFISPGAQSAARYAAKCQVCGREYMTQAKLNQHQRRHHPECLEEDKRYPSKSSPGSSDEPNNTSITVVVTEPPPNGGGGGVEAGTSMEHTVIENKREYDWRGGAHIDQRNNSSSNVMYVRPPPPPQQQPMEVSTALDMMPSANTIQLQRAKVGKNKELAAAVNSNGDAMLLDNNTLEYVCVQPGQPLVLSAELPSSESLMVPSDTGTEHVSLTLFTSDTGETYTLSVPQGQIISLLPVAAGSSDLVCQGPPQQ